MCWSLSALVNFPAIKTFTLFKALSLAFLMFSVNRKEVEHQRIRINLRDWTFLLNNSLLTVDFCFALFPFLASLLLAFLDVMILFLNSFTFQLQTCFIEIAPTAIGFEIVWCVKISFALSSTFTIFKPAYTIGRFLLIATVLKVWNTFWRGVWFTSFSRSHKVRLRVCRLVWAVRLHDPEEWINQQNQ